MFGLLWLFVEEGAFLFDVFSWREEILPRAQAEALISQRVCAGDTGNVWVIFFNVGSIICTTSTAENKEKLLYLKSLKAGWSTENEQRELLLHFMYGKIGFAILTVLCAFAGGCILSSLGKGMTQCSKIGAGAWETWLRIFLGLAEFMAIQWLGLCTSTGSAWIRSLDVEQRPHKPRGTVKKKKERT